MLPDVVLIPLGFEFPVSRQRTEQIREYREKAHILIPLDFEADAVSPSTDLVDESIVLVGRSENSNSCCGSIDAAEDSEDVSPVFEEPIHVRAWLVLR